MKKWGSILVGVLLVVTIYTVRDNFVEMEWDPVFLCESGSECNIDHYEVMVVSELGFRVRKYGPFNTLNTWIEIERPGKVGVYHFLVRAVKMGDDGFLVEGAWCSSLDKGCATLKNGSPGPWRIQWQKPKK